MTFEPPPDVDGLIDTLLAVARAVNLARTVLVIVREKSRVATDVAAVEGSDALDVKARAEK